MKRFIRYTSFTLLGFGAVLSLFGGIIPQPVFADCTTNATSSVPYILRTTGNGNLTNTSYPSYCTCNEARISYTRRNIASACIPQNGEDKFYCYLIPYISGNQVSSSVYTKRCFLTQSDCTLNFNSDTAGSLPQVASGAINKCSEAQPQDDSGTVGDPSTLVPQATSTKYDFLVPLYDPNGKAFVSTNDTPDIGLYIKGMYRLMIALSAVIAVIMIIIGGILYMSTDAITRKKSGKDIIVRTLWGLLLILGSYVILYTINPTLTNIFSISGFKGSVGTPDAPIANGGKGYCVYPYAQGPNTVLYTADCATTEAECQTKAQQWQSNSFGYTYTVYNFDASSPQKACYISSDADITQKKWCIDISINGVALGADCTAGLAYTLSQKVQGLVADKARLYKSQGYTVLSSGSQSVYVPPAGMGGAGQTITIDSYEFIENNKGCLHVIPPHGTQANMQDDCSASDPAKDNGGDAYILNQAGLNACMGKVSGFWGPGGRNNKATFSLGSGNGQAGTTGQICQLVQ